MLSLVNYAKCYRVQFTQLLRLLHIEYPLTINQIEKYTILHNDIPIKDIINLAKIQCKIKEKFPFHLHWMFTEKNAQQASHYLVAAFHGELFKDFNIVADVCCGIGSDLLYLSNAKQYCYAIDLDKQILEYAEFNMNFFNRQNIKYLNIKAEDFKNSVEAVFIDPDRRSNYKRAINPDYYSPSFSTINKFIHNYKNVAVKLSPAFDYEQQSYNSYSYDFVSVKGELKECLLKTGNLVNAHKRRAIILPQKICFEQQNHEETPITSIKEWILEPDPAITRAHLVNDLAYKLNMSRIDPNIALLTSDHEPEDIYGKKFKVKNYFEYSLKKLNQFLKDRNIGIIDIKTKGFSDSVESLRKKLKLKGNNKTLIFIVRISDKHFIIEAC